MKKRVITAVILAAVLIVSLALRQVNAYVFDALILALSIAASVEVALCVNKSTEESAPRITSLVLSIVNACLTGGIFLTCLLTNTLMFLPAFLALALFVTMVVLIVFTAFKYKTFVRTRYLLPLAYPNYLFLFFYLINHLNAFNVGLNGTVSLFLLVFIFVVSMFTDTFAMLTGMKLTGPKLCPKIIPNKSISGFVCALVLGTGAGMALYAIFNAIEPFTTIFANANLQFWVIVLFSFLASLLCQLGDIFESLIKRKLGTKDMGNILPGHGGIMDRLDGISFVTVITFVLGVVAFI